MSTDISSVVCWYVLKPKFDYSLFMWPAILFQPKQSSSTFPSFRLSRLSTSYLSSQIAAFSHNIYAATDRGRTVHLKHVWISGFSTEEVYLKLTSVSLESDLN